jgi:two-component system, NtrC family, response regulator AtoC
MDEEVKKVRVLLVDDDPSVRTAVTIRLQMLNFEVACATNGVQALNVLDGGVGSRKDPHGRHDPPFDADVIVLDLLMPVMDGYEFLKKYSGPIPIVIVSGIGGMEALPREVRKIIEKPIDVANLEVTLREAAASWRRP